MDRSTVVRARRLLTAGVGLLLLGGAGLHCDSGAVGIEACREIESKKCEAAVGCPGVELSEESDVAECKLFYHDQCMFGIADATADPDGILIEACVAAIDQAAACKGAETIADCEGSQPAVVSAHAGSSPCELILFPERLADCSFLRPPDEGSGGSDTTATSGAGGTDGSGGSSGGMGGATTGGIASGGANSGGAGTGGAGGAGGG